MGYIAESWEVGNIKINKVKNEFDFGGEWMYEIVIDETKESRVTHNLDTALLTAIGIKYDGINTQFGKFASNMLGIGH